MFKPRQFNPDSDYQTVCRWWKEHDWPAIPLKTIPKIGVVIERDAPSSEPVCAGWLMKTDTDVAFLEWAVNNPDTPMEERAQALDMLFDTICLLGKHAGFNYIMLLTAHKRLIQRSEDHGFIPTDTGMTSMLRKL